MKKKLFVYIFLVFVFCNFTNILKAEIIEGFCLIKRMDLKQAKLNPNDHFRFLGKEIIFLISFDENLLADVSEDKEVSVITGMYGGSKEFEKIANGVKYKNEIELKGDKEGEFVKYNYNNTIRIVDGKITSLYAKVDQSGFSFNSWNFQIDCRDYAYTETEKQEAKKKENIFDKKKNMPKWFKPLVKEGQKLDLNKKKPSTKEILPLNYTLFIEEDREDYMIVFRYPDATLKGTIIYDSGSNYSKYFRDVYSSQRALTKTFIQPMKLNSDAEMEDYMLPEYKLDEFNYKFLIRPETRADKKDLYILEFESKVGLERIISFLNSGKTFSISTTDDISWHASTFKALNNIDEFKLLAETNPKTICIILSEPLISNLLNKELGTIKILEKLQNNGVNYSNLGCE